MSTTKTFRLTHRVARGLLIATDTIATNSYWMVDSTHPAWRVTVDRLGGVNRVCRAFSSWDECRLESSEFEGELSIENVFKPEGREMVDLVELARRGWEVDPDWDSVLVGYEALGFLPSSLDDSRPVPNSHVGLYDDGRLVGVVVARRVGIS